MGMLKKGGYTTIPTSEVGVRERMYDNMYPTASTCAEPKDGESCGLPITIVSNAPGIPHTTCRHCEQTPATFHGKSCRSMGNAMNAYCLCKYTNISLSISGGNAASRFLCPASPALGLSTDSSPAGVRLYHCLRRKLASNADLRTCR